MHDPHDPETLVRAPAGNYDVRLGRPSKTSYCCSPEIAIPFYPPMQSPSSIRSINQLPIEMVREIFAKVAEVDMSLEVCIANRLDSGDVLSDSTPCLVVVSQVCSLWRKILSSTPTLWSTIRVVPNSQHLGAQIHWTKLFLSRAGTAPLDLVLKDCQSRSGSATSSGCRGIRATRSILSLFISRVQYWRSIDFHVSLEVLDMLSTMTTSSKRYRCPNLRSASLLVSQSTCDKLTLDHLPNPVDFINGIWADHFLAATWKFLLSSQHMREMTWWPGFQRLFLNPPPEMFSQLTRLNVHYSVSAKELVCILANCPCVTQVCASNVGLPSCREHIACRTVTRLVLSSLEFLRLKTTVKVGPLFDDIIAPSLRTLELRYLDFTLPSEEDRLSMKGFLRRSECRLTRFILHHDQERWDFSGTECDPKTLSMYLDSKHLQRLSCPEGSGIVKRDA